MEVNLEKGAVPSRSFGATYVRTEDTNIQYVKGRAFVQVKLFVSCEDYDKAVGMIRQYEQKMSMLVTQQTQSIDRNMKLIFAVFMIGFIIYAIIANQQ